MPGDSPVYRRWKDVPEDLKTRTQWRDLGRVVKPGARAAAIFRGQHGNYGLFSSADVGLKRAFSPRPAKVLEPDIENLAAALYEINKAAKRRRNAASRAYRRRQHGAAQKHRQEKNDYYDLKNRVLYKAITDGLATFVGNHLKTSYRFVICSPGALDDWQEYAQDEQENEKTRECVETKMECWQIDEFKFHRIVETFSRPGEQITDLGEWESPATTKTRHMRIKDAVATLRAYVSLDS